MRKDPDWLRIEKLVAQLENVLHERGTVRHNVWIEDSHGEKQQADVVIEFEEAARSYRVVLEVRRQKSKGGAPWIEQIDGKWQFAPVDKVVAVSCSGFTCPAVREARNRHIELVTFSEGESHDWSVHFALNHLTILEYMLDLQPPIFHLADMGAASEVMSAAGASCAAMLRNKDGSAVDPVSLWHLYVRPTLDPDEVTCPQMRHPFHIRLNFGVDNPLWLVVGGQEFVLGALELAGEYWLEAKEIPLLPVRGYVDVSNGALRGSIIETAEPLRIEGREVFAALVYTPDGDETKGPKLSVAVRDAPPPERRKAVKKTPRRVVGKTKKHTRS